MTRSPTGENPTNGNSEEYDDLTKIRGIGPVKQQLLREYLQVDTFRTLANLSVDEIESQLSVHGHTISRSEIEGWIVQAQELAAVDEQSPQTVELPKPEVAEFSNLPTGEDEPSPAPSRQRTTQEALIPSPEEREWSSFASFTVELQRRVITKQLEEKRTVVRHRETDKLETWSDIEIQQLPRWILNQLSIPRQQATLEPRQAGIEAESSTCSMPIAVEITQVRAFQPPNTEMPLVIDQTSQMFPGTISSGKPFVLEIDLKLVELTATQMVKQSITYYAQCYVRYRSTGLITHLGDTEAGSLVEGQLSYTAMLPEATLPSGMYRLQVLLTVQGAPATPGFLEVPLLPVV